MKEPITKYKLTEVKDIMRAGSEIETLNREIKVN